MMFYSKKDKEIDRLRFENDTKSYWSNVCVEALKNRGHEMAELKKLVVKWRKAYHKELMKRIKLERKYKDLDRKELVKEK